EQYDDRHRMRAPEPGPAGSERDHRRVSGDAAFVQSRNRPHIRRHGSYSCAGHRGARDGNRRLQVRDAPWVDETGLTLKPGVTLKPRVTLTFSDRTSTQ